MVRDKLVASLGDKAPVLCLNNILCLYGYPFSQLDLNTQGSHKV